MHLITYLDAVTSPFASNGVLEVTRIDPGFKGLGGGSGRSSSFSFSLPRGDDSFFSKVGLVPVAGGMSSPKGVLPSDLDLRCVGRGGATGFPSTPARLGAGGTGGARRFTASAGRFFTSGGDGLVAAAPGSSNFGLAGNGGSGTSIPNRFSRLTELQRTGGMGGGESDRSAPVPSALRRSTENLCWITVVWHFIQIITNNKKLAPHEGFVHIFVNKFKTFPRFFETIFFSFRDLGVTMMHCEHTVTAMQCAPSRGHNTNITCEGGESSQHPSISDSGCPCGPCVPCVILNQKKQHQRRQTTRNSPFTLRPVTKGACR